MAMTNIDWLTFTSNTPFFKNYDTTPSEKSFVTNYTTMKRLSKTTSVHYGHNISKKYLVIVTGERAHKVATEVLTIERMREYEITVSRMDIAITQSIIERDFMTVSKFYDNACNGLITRTSKFQQAKAIHSHSHGFETVYLGDIKKRAKKGIFRCYDKGLELDLELYKKDSSHKINANTLTRYELELKRNTANANARAYANGVGLNEIVGKFVTIPSVTNKLDIYPRFTDDEREEREIEHDRLNWIKRVIPVIGETLGRNIARGSLSAIQLYRTFYNNVKHGYESEMRKMLDNEFSDSDIERYENYINVSNGD